jgi:hypothetical protein
MDGTTDPPKLYTAWVRQLDGRWRALCSGEENEVRRKTAGQLVVIRPAGSGTPLLRGGLER